MQRLVNQSVKVQLDNYNSAAEGVLKSLNEAGVVILLSANGKLYFYPMHRITAIEEL